MSDFCHMVQIEVHSPGECEAAQIVSDLCESGRTGRFLHFIENGMCQWEVLVALEDALIEAGLNEGWTFVVGRIEGDAETKGWLEHGGWVFLPYGPERRTSGSDVGIWQVGDFHDDIDCVYWAETPAAPESGMLLNRYLKEQFFIEESLGS